MTEHWHPERPAAVPDECIGRRKFFGAALAVSISALVGFLSRCAVTRVNPLVYTQDQLFFRQLLAAASYDRQAS